MTTSQDATFSGSGNQGLQVGYNPGNIMTHHHYAPDRPETPPDPLILIPFARDPDFVTRETIFNQVEQKCAVSGSWTALVGLGGVGSV
ncbi:hypothetical protein K402DRAFT_399156 [Aulographum hederae CBS 113979]|uniref:Fungal death-pathway protein SesB domain-containing protein n=1 Tax=Aulographum hederae CBS 113979 TaxID=1176131 RepID=A0A6G1GIV0_9PEZI|nr:hypothetical protein K402DRAFT_399156 [Aulographum hederae CBS 113979]